MRIIDDMTDEELALSYIDGDNKAFDLLLSRNQSRIFSYILFVVRDQDVANDIFQETFVKVVTKLQQRRYTTSGKFGAWVMRIAHNVIMDWYREQRSEKIVEPTVGNDLSNLKTGDIFVSSVESRYVNEQIFEDVRHLLECLPTPQREVVFMRFYQQMSFKEIAELTNVSINTALGRMRYAILNLRRMAKENEMSLQMSMI